MTVTVKDVEEEGTVSLGLGNGDGAADTNQNGVVVLQPQVSVEITASANDPDGATAVNTDRGVTTATWQWYRTTSREADGTKIDDAIATTAAYIPMDTAGNSDVGSYLRVVASYTDPRGAGKTAVAVSEYMTLDDITNNTSPQLFRGLNHH